ncbi:MAG: response regulator, partial [Proteobacteria bacterium]|nr:response regulator [Pseudomonadota bacterium]
GKEIISDSRADNRQLETMTTIASLRGAKILLVEDNDINQELALELLQNNGLVVMVANNGIEALTLLKTNDFDGVLMDIQMPTMDGYEATRKIRQQEKYKALPVIAMTANAMAGDKEKVLEAGMNDHIAKPINVNDMFNTMAKWITPANPHLTTDVEIDTAENAELPKLDEIDINAGLAITQGNTALYRKLLIKFRTNYASFPTQFSDALKSDDAEAATRIAHTLKGVAGNIGATGIQQAAEVLEQACINGQADLEELLQTVNDELETVINGLAALESTGDSITTAKVATQQVDNRQVDNKQIDELLSRLRELLEDDDADATETIDELDELPTTAVDQALLKQLSRTVSEYDFEAALKVLDELEASRSTNE